MSDIFLHQSSLHEETARLDQTCRDLVEADRQRAEALVQVSQMLNRVREQSSAGHGDQSLQASGSTVPGVTWPIETGENMFPGRDVDLSPGGRTAIPRVVETSLGALSSAKRTISEFQDDLNSGLTQLAQQADVARRTASTARAHVGFLQQLVSPRKSVAGADSPRGLGWGGAQEASMVQGASSNPMVDGVPLGFAQAGSPNPEIASLLRVLQEAAQQRARAETSLNSPPAGGMAGIWSNDDYDFPQPGSDRSARLADIGSWTPRLRAGDGDEEGRFLARSGGAYEGAVDTPALSKYGRQLFTQSPGEDAEVHGRRTSEVWTSPGRTRVDLLGAETTSPGASQSRPHGLREPGGPAPPSSHHADLEEQTQKLNVLHASVQELEAKRRELVATLTDTSSKVTSCSIELEAVRSELEAAKSQLAAQKQHMQTLHEQRQAAEHRLQEKLHQLQQLDALVHASTVQLAEMQAHVASLGTASHSGGASGASSSTATATGASCPATATPGMYGHRTRLKVKRHHSVRRSRSCSDFAVDLGNLRRDHPSVERSSHSPGSSSRQKGTAPGEVLPPQAELDSGAVPMTDTPKHPSLSPLGSAGLSPSSTSSATFEQMASLQRELQSLTAEHSKVLHQLEQERHASMAHQGEVVALRQRLRAHQVAGITTSSGPASGSSSRSGTTLKRPLSAAMSSMEEVMEEAAADLEQLEGHVANVTQRLLDLQSQNLRLAHQVSAALHTKAAAETEAAEALQRLKAVREEADAVQRSVAASQLSAVRVNAELSAAQTELRHVKERLAEQQEQLQQRRQSVLENEERVQDAQRRLLQEEHGRALAEQARRGAEHHLQQLQARLDEVLQRTQQAEQEGSAVRTAASDLAAEMEKARSDRSKALEELAELQRKTVESRAELAALLESVAAAQRDSMREAEAVAAAIKRREETETELQRCMDELERTRQQGQQCEADLQDLKTLVAVLRQEHQDLSKAAELRKEQAAAAERQAASAMEELEAARATCIREREEAERELKMHLEELQRARQQVQQGEAEARDLQVQLAELRQEQQELASVVERHEQRAAAAERRATATEQDLQATREQMQAAQQQLVDAATQVAAMASAANRASTFGGARFSTPGDLGSQAPTVADHAALGFAGPLTAPTAAAAAAAQIAAGGLRGGPTGVGSLAVAQQHLATILHLQAELDMQQIALVQAQSRQRLAEQRTADAEQLCSELQARLAAMRTQPTTRPEVDAHSTSSSSATFQIWRLKVDELQQELESTQHLLGRYKARLAATQDECSSLEEGLQREKTAAGRWRQQVEALQEELQATNARLRTTEVMLASHQQQAQQQQFQHHQHQDEHARVQRKAASPGEGHRGSPQAGTGINGTSATANTALLTPSGTERPAAAATSSPVELARQHLRMLQAQITQQEKVNNDLLEGHASLQRVGEQMQSQLEEAANQLVTLRSQFEKGKRRVESLEEQRAELQERIVALSALEQQTHARLGELQQQAVAQQQATARAQEELREVHARLADAQHDLMAVVAERGGAVAEAASAAAAERQIRQGSSQSGRAGGGTPREGMEEDSTESVRGLRQQLQSVRQAQEAAEESLAEERRQLQQCKAELAAALTVRASYETATARLQQDLEKLQAQVSLVQVSKPDAKSAPQLDLSATPFASERHLVLVAREAGSLPPPPAGDASPGAAAAMAWGTATPAEVVAARRELHGLELRIAVASADEARMTAACAEVQRQFVAAEQELASIRQQVAEAEQRWLAVREELGLNARMSAVDAVSELTELRSEVRSLQQQMHAAETAEADAKHQAQLASIRLAHVEEQLRVNQEQATQQAQAHATRLDDALAACEQERQRAAELQEHVNHLKQQLEEQGSAQIAQAEAHVAALDAQALAYSEQILALQAALEETTVREEVASEALGAAQGEIKTLQEEVQRLSEKLVLEADAKQQLCLEIARLGQVLTEARTDSERLRVQIAQLMEQLAEAERTRVLMVSESARDAEALAAAEKRKEDLQLEAQDLAGRIGMVESAYSQLRVEAQDLKAKLETALEESRLAKDRVAQLEMGLCPMAAVAVGASSGTQGGSGLGAAAEGSKPHAEEPLQQEVSLRCPSPERPVAQEAVAQLLVDCNALRQARDAAVADLHEAALARKAADVRASELAAANQQLKEEVARLQTLVVAVTTTVEHLQQQRQQQQTHESVNQATQTDDISVSDTTEESNAAVSSAGGADRTAAAGVPAAVPPAAAASASQPESAAYAVLLRALSDHAALERQVAALQSELSSAESAKFRLEGELRSLQEELAQIRPRVAATPAALASKNVSPCRALTASATAAATNPTTAAMSSELEQMLRRQIDELTTALQRAQDDATAADDRTAWAQEREERLARELADVRNAESQARESLLIVMSEQSSAASKLVSLRDKLRTERERRTGKSPLEGLPPSAESTELATVSSTGFGVLSAGSDVTLPRRERLPLSPSRLGRTSGQGSGSGSGSGFGFGFGTERERNGSLQTASGGSLRGDASGTGSETTTATTTEGGGVGGSSVQLVSVPLSTRILELELEMDGMRRLLTEAEGIAQARSQARLDALMRQHSQDLRERRTEEMRRLQEVREEYARLEKHLQAELQHARTAAAQATAELRDCKEALLKAEHQAREAIQEALRSAQQAETFQARVLALNRGGGSKSTGISDGGGTANTAISSGGSTYFSLNLSSSSRNSSISTGSSGGAAATAYPRASGWSLPPRAQSEGGGARRQEQAPAPAVAPVVAMLASSVAAAAVDAMATDVSAADAFAEERKGLESELQHLRRQVVSLEHQRAEQQEELQRAQAKIASLEARHVTALQQVEALNNELRTRERAEADELKARVAQQAESDARLLCELRGQLRDCQERLERSKEELGQARAELERARVDAQEARTGPERLPHGPIGRVPAASSINDGGGDGVRDRQREGAPRQGIVAKAGAAERARSTQQASADEVEAAVRRVLATLMGAHRSSAEELDGGIIDGGSGASLSEADEEYAGARARGALQHGTKPARRQPRRTPRDSRFQSQSRRSMHPQSRDRHRADVENDTDDSTSSAGDYTNIQVDLGSLDLASKLRDDLLELLHRHARVSRSPPSALYGTRSLRNGGNTAGRRFVAATATEPETATSACQTDPVPEYGALVPMVRVSAATNHLTELQQQQSELLSRVAALRCQAAEAEALASARTTRVAELRTREHQLSGLCASLQRQAEEELMQLEDDYDRCKALALESRSALEADCRHLRDLHSDLLTDVQQAQSLLRDTLAALRLGRVSLQAHRAVDSALASLTEAAAADPGGVGSQVLQHVKVVFSCMAELCGRAEALAAAVSPLVTQLGITLAARAHATAAASASSSDPLAFNRTSEERVPSDFWSDTDPTAAANLNIRKEGQRRGMSGLAGTTAELRCGGPEFFDDRFQSPGGMRGGGTRASGSRMTSVEGRIDMVDDEAPEKHRYRHRHEQQQQQQQHREQVSSWRVGGGETRGGEYGGAGQRFADGGEVAQQDTSEVQKAVRWAYQQLHTRARKFGKVLKAMEAGEQLPVQVLQEGFQRLWSSTEEQLDDLMRMASDGGGGGGGDGNTASASAMPPPPAPHQPISNAIMPITSPHFSGHTTTSVAPNTAHNRYGGHHLTHTSENIISGANTGTLRSGGDDLPPPRREALLGVRAPLAPMDHNQLDDSNNHHNVHVHAQQQGSSRYKRSGSGVASTVATTAANRRVPPPPAVARPNAAALQDAAVPSAAGPPLAVEAPSQLPPSQPQPQQQLLRRQGAVPPVSLAASPPPPPPPPAATAARPSASRRQQGVQQQSVQQQQQQQQQQSQLTNPLDFGRELSFAGMPVTAAGAAQFLQQQQRAGGSSSNRMAAPLPPGSRSRCRDEQPPQSQPRPQQQQQQQQRQSIDLQLQQVLNLAKELQSKCR